MAIDMKPQVHIPRMAPAVPPSAGSTAAPAAHQPDGTGAAPTDVPESSVSDDSTALTMSIDNKRAIGALLSAGGRIDLALAKLGKQLGLDPTQKLDKTEFIRALCDGPVATNTALRTAATVQMFDIVSQLTETVQDSLADFEPEEALKAIDSFMKHVETFTRAPAQGQGQMQGPALVQFILQNIPREAGNAVKGLSKMGIERLHNVRRQMLAEQGKLGITDGEFTVKDED